MWKRFCEWFRDLMDTDPVTTAPVDYKPEPEVKPLPFKYWIASGTITEGYRR